MINYRSLIINNLSFTVPSSLKKWSSHSLYVISYRCKTFSTFSFNWFDQKSKINDHFELNTIILIFKQKFMKLNCFSLSNYLSNYNNESLFHLLLINRNMIIDLWSLITDHCVRWSIIDHRTLINHSDHLILREYVILYRWKHSSKKSLLWSKSNDQWSFWAIISLEPWTWTFKLKSMKLNYSFFDS